MRCLTRCGRTSAPRYATQWALVCLAQAALLQQRERLACHCEPVYQARLMARGRCTVAKVSQPFSLLQEDCLRKTNKGPIEWHVVAAMALPEHVREHRPDGGSAVCASRAHDPLEGAPWRAALSLSPGLPYERACRKCCSAPDAGPIGAICGARAGCKNMRQDLAGTDNLAGTDPHRRATHCEVLPPPSHTLKWGVLRHGFPALPPRARAPPRPDVVQPSTPRAAPRQTRARAPHRLRRAACRQAPCPAAAPP